MIKRLPSIFLLAGFLLLVTLSWKQKDKEPPIQGGKGLFWCYVNGKPLVIDSLKASLRKITGGETQLSISNERFVKFTFLNPSTGNFDLRTSTVREAYIRYEDPASQSIATPVSGFVNIVVLDKEKNVISGEFEMDMTYQVGSLKKTLKVTKGKFEEIPIVSR